jgi:8-amino-7-oxononanoate synthase
MKGNAYTAYQNEIEYLKNNNHYRFLRTIQSKDGKYVYYNNKKYINLSSNDYLGLATDKNHLNNFYKQLNDKNIIDLFGLGSTSSRLLTGDFALYSALEKIIADFYNNAINPQNGLNFDIKHAILFNSGYHANIGIIPALTDKNDLILSDALNHASIIDGVRLSHAECVPFEHMNYMQLQDILEKNRNKYNKIYIISESVFSMDGDIIDLKKLIEIKKKYNAFLYIDEAHAVGLFGNTGLGVCERDDAINDIDVILGTFGKSLASQGAYAVVKHVLKEYLINKMRSLIYSTAQPPVIVNWNLYNMKMISSFDNKREKLGILSRQLRESLINNGIITGGESQIVPAILGDMKKTSNKSEMLMERGFLLFPIRPPTVPEGSSRIRISLTANIEWEDIKDIASILCV